MSSRKDGIPDNPWPYADNIPLLHEADKLDVNDLECRSQYQISTVKIENEQARDNEVYRIFGSMMNQDSGFMRQWLCVYVLTHLKAVCNMAKEYLSSKGLTLQTWLISLREGKRADILRLFLLCLATQTHCFVHHKNGYWTTLLDPPETHMELIQRCNIHLSYLGRGIFADHVL